ncbi:ComEA family DNA-binding protein [Catenovulum adriaticum]|uniref:Helix-hairpin-helix domain-containing protein n=1 Tax=Catenovulum adriaticum TaxID=2984846 RepID=A0ABY7AMS6_9ALTE|nr:helix-hairpin-helix domain-containing protein [Catenovulum sp. TS8]WAJ70844.1 helix-hairpin-helix domain-containing protein [Catenovulum sp. TS8]
MKRLILSIALLTSLNSIQFNALANETSSNSTEVVQTEDKKAKININDATLAQLTAVPGLGKSKAQAIIKYREIHGNITDEKQLKSIKGIGKKTLAKIVKKFELGQ